MRRWWSSSRSSTTRAPEEGVAQSLAAAATIGLLQQRAIQESELLASQLQEALHSRVVTEQAKGVLAERWQVVPDSAFKALRGYARAHNMLLSRLAESVVAGDRTGEDLRAYLDRVGVDAARPERGRARR